MILSAETLILGAFTYFIVTFLQVWPLGQIVCTHTTYYPDLPYYESMYKYPLFSLKRFLNIKCKWKGSLKVCWYKTLLFMQKPVIVLYVALQIYMAVKFINISIYV